MDRQRRLKFSGNSLIYGKLWIGSKYDSFMIGFVLSSYLMLQFYYFYFFSEEYWIESKLNILSTIIFLYNYCNGTFTEPGVISKQILEEETIEDQEATRNNQQSCPSHPNAYFEERYCNKCKIMRPPKSSHCYQCKNCVKSFDHHCNFMANCIGERNYKYFIGWIYSLVFQCAIWYITLLQHFYSTFSISMFVNLITTQLVVQISIICLLLSCCCAFGICCARGIKCIALLSILCNIILILQFSYDREKSYYQNYFCSLIFIILTIPGALFSVEVCLTQTFHLSIGINQKEWSVLQKNAVRQIVDNQQTEIQTMKEEIETEEDKELKIQINIEISKNQQLLSSITQEQIEAIDQSRRNYNQRQKNEQTFAQSVTNRRKQPNFRAFLQNVLKLLSDKMPPSEIY